MRVGEYLTYRARLKGLHGGRLRARVDDVVVQCDLKDVYRSVIGTLSKGFRQRVGLADSLVHEPAVLILDEPTLGLDPNQIRHVRQLIKGLARRYTVLLSSHILHEIESVCERVLIMNHGRIVTSDTTESLMAVIKGHSVVTVELHGPAEEMEKRLQTLTSVARVTTETLERGWSRFRIECRKGRDVRIDLFHMASLNGWILRELREERRNLEDVFVSVTMGLGQEPDGGGSGDPGGIVIEEGETP
jgi:ABC-2 type transport system ATP-binding protein